jgi:hypothetical protein
VYRTVQNHSQMKQSYNGLVPKCTEMVILLQPKCTELYRNVPNSVHRYMANVPKHVPKCTETYRNVPKHPPSGVPKRTERIYRYVQVRYIKGFGTSALWGGLVDDRS